MMPPLIDRIDWAYHTLAPIKPRYAIVWEDPDEIDAPCRVTSPAPEWLAMALHGNLLPPVEVYQRMREAMLPDGSSPLHYLQDTAAPIGPMTEEEAMEYLLMKDVPRRVWDGSRETNRRLFVFTERKSLPTDRTFREAWRLAQ